MLRVFVTVFLFLLPGLLAQDVAEDTWKKALKFHEEAEERIRKGANSEAIVLLNTTMETLREVQYNFPKWNPSVVRTRLMAVRKRVEDVEKLILSSFAGMTREQLLDKLRETEVSKAKFSKAMMIIYEKLKDTQEVLRLKTKDLEEAQKAASKKITDQAHLDKMTFENLKMKKSIDEKNAQIKLLQAKITEAQKNSGDKAMQSQYEQKLIELSKSEKQMMQDKEAFLKERKKIVDALKDMSIKYKEVTLKEKTYEENLSKLQDEISGLKKQITEETALKKKFAASSENLADKLELATNRLIQLEVREKKLTTDLADLRKGKKVTEAAMDVEKTAALQKELNHLKQVEIDLKSKLDATTAESEKNKELLKSYMAENGPKQKKSKELQEQIASLKKSLGQKEEDSKIKNAQMISMSSEIASLKAQQKIQQNIVDSLKKRLTENTKEMKEEKPVKVTEQDAKLLAAYEKAGAELKAKLDLAEKKISELEKRNETLKKENLLGDEEMIRKYVQIRNEYKAYKAKTREIYRQMEKKGETNGVMQAAFTEEEKKEMERADKLRDFLFRAQKAEKEENFQAALGLYTEALQLDPQNFDALFRIGLIHYNRRHFQDAVVHLKKAFYKEPDDTNLLLALGLSYLEQDKIELAVSYLSRVVGLKPDDSLCRLQLGVSLQGLGWTEAAFEQLKKACELDTKNGEAAFNLAMVSLALPEPKVSFAKSNYERAVKLGIARDSQLEKYFEQYKDN